MGVNIIPITAQLVRDAIERPTENGLGSPQEVAGFITGVTVTVARLFQEDTGADWETAVTTVTDWLLPDDLAIPDEVAAVNEASGTAPGAKTIYV